MKCYCCDDEMAQIIKPKVFKCQQCAHIFRNFSINEQQFYQKYRETHKTYPTQVREKYISNLLGLIGPFLDRTHTILEVGSGDGLFALSVKKYVDEVVCCELDGNLAEQLSSRGFETFNKDLLLLNEERIFDSVVALDVIEHVKDLNLMVEKMSRIAKQVIIQVPVDRAIHQKEPFDGHYHYFSPQSLISVFSELFTVTYLKEKTDRKFIANGPEMIAVFKNKRLF